MSDGRLRSSRRSRSTNRRCAPKLVAQWPNLHARKRTLLPRPLRLTFQNMDEHISLADVSQLVVTEIETFVVPAPRPDQLGEILPAAWFAQQLDESGFDRALYRRD